jgi:hypothetical protein
MNRYAHYLIGIFCIISCYLRSMNLERQLINSSCTLDTLTINPHLYPELAKFYKKYSIPSTFLIQFKEHIDQVVCVHFGSLDSIPSLFSKGKDINRIINAKRMKHCIKKYNLTLLDVAKKYIFYIKDEWRVYAQTIPYSEWQPLSLEQVKQLKILSEKTGFNDWNFGHNWVYQASINKLICIDTENDSFGAPSRARAIFDLFQCVNHMTPEAQNWITLLFYALPHADENTSIIPLCNTTSYDREINLEQVKEELIKHTNEQLLIELIKELHIKNFLTHTSSSKL